MPWLQKRPLTHVAPVQRGLARPWVAWVRFFPIKCQNVPLAVRNSVSVRVFHRSLQHSEVSTSINRQCPKSRCGGQFWRNLDGSMQVDTLLLTVCLVFCRRLRCSAARGDVVPAAPGRRSGCGFTASAWLPRVSRLSQSRTESSFS